MIHKKDSCVCELGCVKWIYSHFEDAVYQSTMNKCETNMRKVAYIIKEQINNRKSLIGQKIKHLSLASWQLGNLLSFWKYKS